MTIKNQIKKSFLVSLWFMFLTFPILVIQVNTVENFIKWRWINMISVGAGSFFLSILWHYWFEKRQEKGKQTKKYQLFFFNNILHEKKIFFPVIILLSLFILCFPHIFSMYQTNIMISALIYVMMGLGLNIVIGLAGLLDLGYVAFFAVGAYSYALLNYHYGLIFWLALPLGGILALIFGVILGYPVLRLRGDYLAIVTLGFGEIIRLVLENWNDFSFGPSGISNIPKPCFLGIDLSLQGTTKYLFYIIVGMVALTIFIINRLENSRIGRAWIALKDDEIACQAMGINKGKTKLRAFGLGAMWAGMGGVIFAAKTTFINPASFTIWESVIILCTVVLGGMGSITGVAIGALLLILLPEYLRAFSEFRMIIFGAVLVLMMVFRPGGIIKNVRRTYKFDGILEKNSVKNESNS